MDKKAFVFIVFYNREHSKLLTLRWEGANDRNYFSVGLDFGETVLLSKQDIFTGED